MYLYATVKEDSVHIYLDPDFTQRLCSFHGEDIITAFDLEDSILKDACPKVYALARRYALLDLVRQEELAGGTKTFKLFLVKRTDALGSGEISLEQEVQDMSKKAVKKGIEKAIKASSKKHKANKKIETAMTKKEPKKEKTSSDAPFRDGSKYGWFYDRLKKAAVTKEALIEEVKKEFGEGTAKPSNVSIYLQTIKTKLEDGTTERLTRSEDGKYEIVPAS